jgi:hypothetical protein
MRLFTVHLPLSSSGKPTFERAEFVGDGFYGLAFLFNVIWCLWKGLWIAALAILAAGGALYGIGRALQLSADAQFWLQLVLALLVGIEAANLRRFGLSRRGYIDAGTVAASDLGEAEAIYFSRIADEMDLSEPANPTGSAPPTRERTEDVVGLFPEYRTR